MAKIEAGKWYKNRQWGRPTRDFAKAITATSESIQFSEKIHDGGFVKKTDWWGAVETCVEASPEEYMHFLPDGHPDKNSIIVGAWYKHHKWASNDFVKIKRIGSYSIFFSEKIDGGHYSNEDDEWGTGCASPKECVEADLSEYSEYLPDGHPDKVSSLEQGKWYELVGQNYYIKFKGIEDGHVAASEYIDDDKVLKGVSRFSKLGTYKYRLVSNLTEISDCLPTGHVDKVKIKTSTFPSEGYCMSTDARLIKYLTSRPNQRPAKSASNAIGLAWNQTSYWWIATKSSKTNYSLADLEPYLTGITVSDKEAPVPTSSDIFVVGKQLNELALASVGIQAYKDGKGKEQYNSKYNLCYEGHERILKVTEDYFLVSGFIHGWFKKSDALGYEPVKSSVTVEPKYTINKLPKGEYFFVSIIGTDWDRITIGTGSPIVGDSIKINTKEFTPERSSVSWVERLEYVIRPATKPEIEWLNACSKNTSYIPLENVDKVLRLINDAVRKYPIGTRFHLAHRGGTDNISYVVNNKFEVSNDCSIICSLTDEDKDYSESCSRYGNHNYVRTVYYKGTWANYYQEDLTDRYIKAVITSPEGGNVSAGDYGKFKTRTSNGDLKVDFPKHSGYHILKENLYNTSYYEIMPVGWKPTSLAPVESEVGVGLTSLPKKWAIKITIENKTILGNWRTDGPLTNGIGNYLHTPYSGRNGYNAPTKFDGYTEITFEQFKEWVLKVKEEAKIEEWSAATYGVLLNDYRSYGIGLVDKILESNDKQIKFEKFLSYEPFNPSYCGAQFKWFATIEEATAFSKTLTNTLLSVDGVVIRPNNIYHFTLNNGTEWIVDVANISDSKNIFRNYSLRKGEFYKSSGGSWGNTCDVTSARLANKSDINWLEACIKAGQYVEKPIAWCVQVTHENRDVVKSFMVNEDWQFNIGSYYGINEKGDKEGSRYSSDFNENVITTEEFYKKIGYFKLLSDTSGSMSSPFIEVELVQPKEFTSVGLGLYTLLETSKSFPIYIERPPIKTKTKEVIELKLIQPKKLKINLVV